MLAERVEMVPPGVCETRLPEQGGDPKFWTGLRPAPTNIPTQAARGSLDSG